MNTKAVMPITDEQIAELEMQCEKFAGFAVYSILVEQLISRLRAAEIDAARLANPAGQWVAVSERLPNVAQEVIIFSGFEGVCAGVLDSYGEWFAPCSEYKLTRVTHWMPLPAAPEVV